MLKRSGLGLKGNLLIKLSPKINSASIDTALFIALKILNLDGQSNTLRIAKNTHHIALFCITVDFRPFRDYGNLPEIKGSTYNLKATCFYCANGKPSKKRLALTQYKTHYHHNPSILIPSTGRSKHQTGQINEQSLCIFTGNGGDRAKNLMPLPA